MRTIIPVFLILSCSPLTAGEKKFSRSVVSASPRPGSLRWIQEVPVQPQPIAPAKAFLRSLLLPGWGESYAGRARAGHGLIASEIGLWFFWGTMRISASWQEQGLSAYAKGHAGVRNFNSRDDQFILDLGDYVSVFDYNQEQLRSRRTGLYDTDRDYWFWDSELSRQKYRSLRIGRDRASQNAEFIAAGIVLNHFVSAVNALRLARKHNRTRSTGLNWELKSTAYRAGLLSLSLQLSR